MRHCAEEEKAAYDDMLRHMLVPLCPAPIKVWMVHRESGVYSDWTYDVKGIFSSYELARKYVEQQLVVPCYQYYDGGYDIEPIDADMLAKTVTTRLVSKDGVTFWNEFPDGSRIDRRYSEYNATWYITEYGVDDEVVGKVG